MKKDTSSLERGQDSKQQSEVLGGMCYRFVKPLLKRLYEKLDRRLVQTLLDMIMVI